MFISECNKRYPDKTINVVVPTTILRDSWLGYKGHIHLNKLQNVNVYIVNTYVKSNHECALLICDELHHYASESSQTFKTVIARTKFNWFVGLSATLDKHHKIFLEQYGIKQAGLITSGEAMEKGWISPYKILCVPVDLNDVDRERYDKMHKEFNKHFATFNFDFNLAMKCVVDSNTRIELAEKLSWDKGRIDAAVFNWNRNMRLRKQFLYHIEAKIDAAIEITRHLKLNTILFGQSIEGADKIADSLGDCCVEYHSDMTKTQAKLNLKKLKDGRTKVTAISSAKGLEEGFDLPNLSLGITWSRTSKQLRANQVLGRICRHVENKTAYMIELYVPSTQDEKWMNASLKGQKNVYRLNSIEQIYDIIEADKQKLL
jgi:superfamily II DNA or RNA helicase